VSHYTGHPRAQKAIIPVWASDGNYIAVLGGNVRRTIVPVTILKRKKPLAQYRPESVYRVKRPAFQQHTAMVYGLSAKQ
jgi:hypothetical protein